METFYRLSIFSAKDQKYLIKIRTWVKAAKNISFLPCIAEIHDDGLLQFVYWYFLKNIMFRKLFRAKFIGYIS